MDCHFAVCEHVLLVLSVPLISIHPPLVLVGLVELILVLIRVDLFWDDIYFVFFVDIERVVVVMGVAMECRFECLILLSPVLEFGQFHGISFCFVVVITHLIHHDPIRAFLCTPESAMRLVLRDHVFLKRLAQWPVCRVETHRWYFTGCKLTKRLLAFEV